MSERGFDRGGKLYVRPDAERARLSEIYDKVKQDDRDAVCGAARHFGGFRHSCVRPPGHTEETHASYAGRAWRDE